MTTTREVFYGATSQGVAPHFFVMENNKICSFFGHRDIEITDELYAKTAAEILKAVALTKPFNMQKRKKTSRSSIFGIYKNLIQASYYK